MEDAPILADFMTIQGKETEDLDLNLEDTMKGVISLLNRPYVGTYFVVFDESNPTELMGMMMIHFEMNFAIGGLIYWINSVYVHSNHRQKGVFRKLYDHVTDMARADPKVKAVRLYVEVTNKRAMTVYSKVGMINIEEGYDFHEVDYCWTD